MVSQNQIGQKYSGITISLCFTGYIAITYGFGVYLFPAVLPEMQADLALNYTQIGLITALSQIGYLAASFGSGLLTACLKGSVIILSSVLICGFSLAGLGLTGDPWLTGLLLTVLRACTALAWVPMVEIVGRAVKFENRSKVLGLISSGTSYGVFTNGLMVPYFVLNHHWRDIWLTAGAGCLVFLSASYWLLRRAGVFTGRTAGFEAACKHPKADSAVHNELTPDPPRNFHGSNSKARQLVKTVFTPSVSWLLFIFFLSGMAYIPFQTYLSAYLRDDLELGIELTGQVWSMIGFVGMGSGFIMGVLSDRIGIRPVLALTYLLTAFAAAVLSFSPEPAWAVIAGLAFGLAFYAVFGLIPAYISKVYPPQHSTMIFGVTNGFLALGCMAGNLLGGLSKSLSGTFLWVYLWVGVIALLLIPLTYLLPSEYGRKSMAGGFAASQSN